MNIHSVLETNILCLDIIYNILYIVPLELKGAKVSLYKVA